MEIILGNEQGSNYIILSDSNTTAKFWRGNLYRVIINPEKKELLIREHASRKAIEFKASTTQNLNLVYKILSDIINEN